VYDQKPERFLANLYTDQSSKPASELYCAGFELQQWRCKPFAFHLAEWLPDYALPEDELRVNHANSLLKLNQAAVRVYTSAKYEKRGEAGEIALHAICRDFFGTIPVSPRVFYKSASNDVVKAFDMVHVRFPPAGNVEIWLGESKLYTSGSDAISDAITSIKTHIEGGFLSNQKLLLGPQIPKTTPRYDEIIAIFKKQASLDVLLNNAVFAVGILCDSKAVKAAKEHTVAYVESAKQELLEFTSKLQTSGLTGSLKLALIYMPLASKADLVQAFDSRLKGLQ
jgi:hypothetical protein